jgi:hypothetical protein
LHAGLVAVATINHACLNQPACVHLFASSVSRGAFRCAELSCCWFLSRFVFCWGWRACRCLVCSLPGWSASACCHVLAFIMLAYWWVVPGGQTRCYPPVQLTGWLLLPCQLDVRDGRCAVAGGGGWLPWQLAHTLAMAGSNPAVPRQTCVCVCGRCEACTGVIL